MAARGARAAPDKPIIGYLSGETLVIHNFGTGDAEARYAAAVREGLRELGYVEGQNVAIEYRFSQGQDDRLPAFAREFEAFRCGSFSLLASVAWSSSRL